MRRPTLDEIESLAVSAMMFGYALFMLLAAVALVYTLLARG